MDFVAADLEIVAPDLEIVAAGLDFVSADLEFRSPRTGASHGGASPLVSGQDSGSVSV